MLFILRGNAALYDKPFNVSSESERFALLQEKQAVFSVIGTTIVIRSIFYQTTKSSAPRQPCPSYTTSLVSNVCLSYPVVINVHNRLISTVVLASKHYQSIGKTTTLSL